MEHVPGIRCFPDREIFVGLVYFIMKNIPIGKKKALEAIFRQIFTDRYKNRLQAWEKRPESTGGRSRHKRQIVKTINVPPCCARTLLSSTSNVSLSTSTNKRRSTNTELVRSEITNATT